MSKTEERVITALQAVFENKGLRPPQITPDTELGDSLGLESLDFAELVVRLEMAFGKDPFAAADVPPPTTVRQLAALYD